MGNYFITGASTGIGRATAAHLAAQGHRVFAGVRTQTDAESLVADIGSGVVPVLVDVTDQAQVAEAAALVASAVGSAGLDGLINNAGIAKGGALEHTPLEEFRHVVEVNLIGQVGVTQAFIPLVRAAKGRIVYTGSISGIVGLPMLSAYTASKFGLAGVAQSVRAELAPWGIKVVLIEPGPVFTPMTQEKSGDEMAHFKAIASPQVLEQYAAHVRAGDRIVKFLKSKAVPVGQAVDAMDKALFRRHPRHTYYVGFEAAQTALGARTLPPKVFAFVAAAKTGSRIPKA